jgi:serine palmitoyltransferase
MRDLVAEIPFFVALSTYLSWTLLFLIGHVRDLLAKLFWGGTHAASKAEKGYAELRQDYEDFYTRRAYKRVIECFERPVASAPGRTMDIIMRSGKLGQMEALQPNGEIRTVVNMGSYNYLGFASQVRRPPGATAQSAPVGRQALADLPGSANMP